jgi:hypothetical protein
MELNGFIKREGTWVEKAKELWAVQERRLQLEKLEALLKQDLITTSGEENSQGGGFIWLTFTGSLTGGKNV